MIQEDSLFGWSFSAKTGHILQGVFADLFAYGIFSHNSQLVFYYFSLRKDGIKMKKHIIVLVAIVCLLLISVSLCKVSVNKSEQSKAEEYREYLSQIVEDDFTGIDGVESANAIVSYDESQDQYSVELSLITEEDINEEQVELYKSVLRKTYVEVKLMINGVLR